MSAIQPSRCPFDDAVDQLQLDSIGFWFRQTPGGSTEELTRRIKLAAKLLSRAINLQHSKALEAVAQALRFPTWHHLSAHLERAKGFAAGKVPLPWLNSLSAALVLLAAAKPDVDLPAAQIAAFEGLAQTLSMLTDQPAEHVLNGVCAGLCGARSWGEVCSRSPLRARLPLYSFVVDVDADFGGRFVKSAACERLMDELDSRMDAGDDSSRSGRKAVRRWVEDALAAQPGFLEGGLALAWMQHDAGEPGAAQTAERFVKQAEALLPEGFKGPILWSVIDNRFYHRLLWLRMKLHCEGAELRKAATVARKQLKLNPNDNLGVRYVLPLLLLQQGEYQSATKATRLVADEPGLLAAAIRAFCEHAVGNCKGFRKELAHAVFSFPMLRLVLLNQTRPLPDGDDGVRGMRPDVQTFIEYGWPAYLSVPGLRAACEAFLAEPGVLRAEAELRQYWKAFWPRGESESESGQGSLDGWAALGRSWVERVS